MELYKHTCKVQHKGFTLIELMVVVAIIAVLASIATPSFRRMIVGNQIRSAVNDWTLAMQTARSEAVRQRARVTLCPSANGSTCDTTASFEHGWIVAVMDGAGTDMAKLVQDYPPLRGVTMTSNLASNGAITYLANGMPIGNFAGMTITVMEDAVSHDASLTRYICVARSGRTRVINEDLYLAGGCA